MLPLIRATYVSAFLFCLQRKLRYTTFSDLSERTLTTEWPSRWDMILRRYERNNAAEKGVRNDIWGETAKCLLNCKSRTFLNRKGFDDVRIVGVFLFKNPHFLQVLNWGKLAKNALFTKTTKNQAIFIKEWKVVKTGLKKSQKTTEIFFDEASRWIMVRTHNTDLKKQIDRLCQKSSRFV